MNFQEDGFILGERILSDKQIENLLSDFDFLDKNKVALSRNISRTPDKELWQIVNLWWASEEYKKLIYNDKIVSAAARLINANELRVYHDQTQFKYPIVGDFSAWHQDSPCWPMIDPKDQQISAWIALDDADETNGCMYFIPGSHKQGVDLTWQNLKNFEDRKGIPCPVPKGYVHYHHGLVWHAAPANKSDKPRRAISIHYMTEKSNYVYAGEDYFLTKYISANQKIGEKLEGDWFPLVWRNCKK